MQRKLREMEKMSPALNILLLFMVYFTAVVCTEGEVVKECRPAPTLTCGGDECDVFNYQGIWDDRSVCKAGNVAWPSSEAELVDVVAHAVRNEQKIKVVSRHAHSLSKLVCVENKGLIISTLKYDSILGVDEKAMTITVQAGASMRDVVDAAAKHNLALPAMAYISGFSAAGAISTGAHGSGFAGKGSGVYEYVVGMRMVLPASPSEGYAKIICLTEADDDLKAARLSLGTLGAISEITFALQPMFKRSVSVSVRDDSDLENVAPSFLRNHSFGDLRWLPGQGKVIFQAIDEVSVDVVGNGSNEGVGAPTTVAAIEASAYQVDEIQGKANVTAICDLVGTQTLQYVAIGNGFLNDGKSFTGYPVVGFNNRMQTSGECERVREESDESCTQTLILDKNDTTCGWDRRVHTTLLFDMVVRLPLRRFERAMRDVKKIRDLNPERMCDQTVIGIRSIKKSEAYLGPSEDQVTMELITYRPREKGVPKWNEDVYQEIEQMLIKKYGGVVHWGKTGTQLFTGLAVRTVNLKEFLKVKERFDPKGLFSNDLTDGLFGIGGKSVGELRDGCALDKVCICREDKHCAPDKGFLCKPGRVWKYARVCRNVN